MLGDRIKDLRVARQISQQELATKMGVTKQTVSNWENDNADPTIRTIIDLAYFFGVSADYLLGISQKSSLNTLNLTDKEVVHLQAIIEDIRRHR